MNTKPCGECLSFFALEKGLHGGTKRLLSHGYCLKKSVFAANKPGNPVYPPRSCVQDLPNAVHKLKIVKSNQLEKTCNEFNAK
jgi:hypothetical protein